MESYVTRSLWLGRCTGTVSSPGGSIDRMTMPSADIRCECISFDSQSIPDESCLCRFEIQIFKKYQSVYRDPNDDAAHHVTDLGVGAGGALVIVVAVDAGFGHGIVRINGGEVVLRAEGLRKFLILQL